MKMTLTILILLISMRLFAPGITQFCIEKAEAIKPYERIWDLICKIESNNDSLAFCIDINGLPSVGIAQIQESRLDDFNRANRTNFVLNDCFNPRISKQIFMFFAHGDLESISRKWNGGPNGLKYSSTIAYYQKVLYIAN
jgi:hypothetical protein